MCSESLTDMESNHFDRARHFYLEKVYIGVDNYIHATRRVAYTVTVDDISSEDIA